MGTNMKESGKMTRRMAVVRKGIFKE